MDSIYNIGGKYKINPNWSFTISGYKTEKDILRLRKDKMVMLTAAMVYDFQSANGQETNDWIFLPIFLPIDLISFHQSEWELDENYILPFQDQDEKYPNNPDTNSFKGAEQEMYYDIKMDISSFPEEGKREQKMPYILETDIQKLILTNSDIIWVQLSSTHERNAHHEKAISAKTEQVLTNTFSEIQYSRFIFPIKIPLTEEYAKNIVQEIEMFETQKGEFSALNIFATNIEENIISDFTLEAIAIHTYESGTERMRFDEDIDINKNMSSMIKKKIILKPDLLQMVYSSSDILKKKILKNAEKDNEEYYGIFSYLSNNKTKNGNREKTKRQLSIKVPLVLMEQIYEPDE